MKKDILKFMGSLGIFSVGAVAFYIVLVVVWGHLPRNYNNNLKDTLGGTGFMYTRTKEAKVVQDVDIVFLGSSHTYRGFDPRIFKESGYSSFNLGSSNQSLLQTLVLVRRYIENLNPEIIILEICPNRFVTDGVESSIDIIDNDTNDFESFKLALKQNHIKVYNALIYSSYRDLVGTNVGFIEDSVKGKDTYISGGYVEKHDPPSYQPRIRREREIQYNRRQMRAFEAILAIAKKRNSKVILVQSPTTDAYYNTYRSENPDFDNLMQSYANYYNFNELLPIEDTRFFYDTNHLNQQGVNLFNAKLIELALSEE